MNAVNDALAAIGAPSVALPATPEKLWRTIRRGKAFGGLAAGANTG
jgi:hypothetical protein